ncbi:probable E3 ubiquitin-protein ligase ARI7 [Hordeum vulgare subsp. vulgare]|uniref:probable E3 ubiquitin-protein ligase ARI7 n=1 Tax=Hordeum vulgare subsp. vulgare TaxID=112509 RepID=UPI001D1A4199|nr:probable E3 ubiquitin-protein ligase ARI7 [Hordeum vulgare subsp. vulgare]
MAPIGDDEKGYSDFDDEEDPIVLESDDDMATVLFARKQKYKVLSVDAVRALQAECIAGVADLIQVPPSLAAIVLRHCHWSALVVQEKWFSDEQGLRAAVGLLPPTGDPVAAVAEPKRKKGKSKAKKLTCDLCFDAHPPGQMRSAGCGHLYCRVCWRGYVRAAVEDGARCLSLRCPEPSCSAAVIRDLVDDVADEEDKQRYAGFALRSYVEESKSMRWCPAPGCGLAVEYLGGESLSEQLDVVCECGHGFCILCAEESHLPVPCRTVREWKAKNSSESESTNWVLANTKLCPKCRRPIEKNTGCNHMTCRDPCGHQFCWICLADYRGHTTCNRYEVDEIEARQTYARASLDRYMHYYERWVAHEHSRQRASEDMFELESAREGYVDGSAAAEEAQRQLGFLIDAYRQILEGRRMLRWTYAYGYYADWDKLNLLQCLQGEAEGSLERLHGMAEAERTGSENYYGGDGGVSSYFDRLTKLTKQTHDYFESMAEAFQTDLD